MVCVATRSLPLVMPNTDRFARLLLAAWAGGLWTVCALVVPALFHLIANKTQAGNVAAPLFYLQSVLGVVFGVLYGYLRWHRLDLWSRRCVMIAVLAPLVFLAALRPWMNALRASGEMARFAQLHGVAGMLFLIACVALGVLVWRAESTHPVA